MSMRTIFALLLCLLTIAPAAAGIVGKDRNDSSATATGGVALPSKAERPYLQCWLEGRMIADPADPYLLSYGLPDRPATVVIRGANGVQTVRTTIGSVASMCFPELRR